ncbi:TetR family transcriptional regulator [Actinoplanes sp. NPDC051411]|uniref:TetR family transcriptional regulator n=1 Tax=Actinoplanes sp. NPDC051411 TaxID=3155522 RepID=UPI0034138CAB
MARPRTVTDEAILAAAARAVAATGPADVTLAHVGAGAGLTAAALLRRFGSKRGLLLALARHGATTLPAHLGAAHDVDDLVERLAGMAAGMRDPVEFANHLAFLLLDVSDPEFRAISRDYTAAVEAAIGRVAGASNARAVHAAYNGALLTWGMAGGDGDPAEDVRDQLRRVLGKGWTR